MKISKEEKQKLEEKVNTLRAAADQAHEAAANAPEDDALAKAADDAEEAVTKAQEELDAAEVDETPAPSGEEDDEGDDNKDIDFDEEAKRLGIDGQPPAPPPAPKKSELEAAETALFFNAKRVKELGGDPNKVIAPENPPATPPAPQTPPAAPADDNKYASKEDLAEIEAAKLSRSEQERKVVMYYYRNMIKPTGNIVADVENAYLLAHKGRISRSFDEIRRAGFSRPAPGTAPGRRPPAKPIQQPQLSVQDQVALKRRGFKQNSDGSWEGRRYVIKYDPNKKSWVEEKKKA